MCLAVGQIHAVGVEWYPLGRFVYLFKLGQLFESIEWTTTINDPCLLVGAQRIDIANLSNMLFPKQNTTWNAVQIYHYPLLKPIHQWYEAQYQSYNP